MSGYSPDASAVVTFWRIWSATTPPVVALTLMSECVLLNSSASSPRTLPAMSSWPCHIVISVTPPDLLVVASAAPAAACERQDDDGRQGEDWPDADHCGTSERTTERVRLRGRSGSSPAASASATPVRWARMSEASGSRSSATAMAPAARTLSSSASSADPEEPHRGARAGDADRAVAVLEGRVRLGPRLGGLAQLQRRLAGQPDGPAAAEERPAVGLAGRDRERRVERGRARRPPARRGRSPRGRAAG